MDGAKFADRHGFHSVWTPERHFHQKGGLYPNPSVLSSALAAITDQIQLRAGSVVMPLHNPLRVAEEWSIVDNISRGRVGISFASGWVANDFAFFPERYANKRSEMFKGIAQVQKLWRGEKIPTTDGTGKTVEIGVFPKPIQKELPIWLTCSGAPEMFTKAGEMGFNVLTSLQEQSFDEVAVKLKAYRDARKAAGHDPSTGNVAMMMHTFVGQEKNRVLDKVKGPLMAYLRSHIELIKTSSHSLDIQKDLKKEGIEDSLAAFAFERYHRTASLIGTPETCFAMVKRLESIGVCEIACLIDFGVDVESVLESLEYLNILKDSCQARPSSPAQEAVLDRTKVLIEFLQQKLPPALVPVSLTIVDSLHHLTAVDGRATGQDESLSNVAVRV
jgi:natural product biosynthesis luciferase-like monooxygenase protein